MPTLKSMLTGLSGASYVEYGYGQVEPNHLSAQYTGQIYAQLPADKNITKLEQGQFVKYDYAAHTEPGGVGLVNFTGKGEWMLVFNEIKLYREGQWDCEFAMLKDNYQARVYSPYDPDNAEADKQARFYNGVDSQGNSTITVGEKTYTFDDVTAAPDMYELHYNEDPFHFLGSYKEKMMPTGTTMVPRVFKTNVGDIFTTNTINATAQQLTVGTELYVGDNGILTTTKKTTANANGAESGDMVWQVVKVYTMPDHQKGVKVMRIK